ncbi:DUF2306 domain-containing protein [Glaciecola sp. 1036]|uniref:DUF2306 domain-containing protein n=1 Tax=Alteromonadaceae TaxID=72275 RepID=UPI003D058A57
MLVFLHIFAGSIALLAGTISFLAKKGANTHRKAGKVFVISMVLMTLSGALLAFINDEMLNMVAGLVTFYLVCTAFVAARITTFKPNLTNLSLAFFGLLVGVYAVLTGFHALSQGIAKIDGNPTQVIIVFGTISLLAALADTYLLKKQKLNNKARLVRHSWRIGVAMFIAAASFFLGQSQVFPGAIRNSFLLVTPVLLVLLSTIYWVVRVRVWGLKRRT